MMAYRHKGMGQCDFADPSCNPGPAQVTVTGVVGGTEALSQINAAAANAPESPASPNFNAASVADAALAPLGGISGAVGWAVGAVGLIAGLIILDMMGAH